MEKLLNIELFFTENSFKSKLKNIGQFGHILDLLGKLLLQLGCNEGDLENFRPKL